MKKELRTGLCKVRISETTLAGSRLGLQSGHSSCVAVVLVAVVWQITP